MKQIRHYSNYFFFFFTRFNPLLAACLLYDEIKGERKYGLHTTGFERPARLNQHDFAATSAFSYMPSNYVLLERLFDKLNTFSHNQTFLDVGCGKGRVLYVAAHYNFKKLLGIELVKDYCARAEEAMNKMNSKFSETTFEIICTDASQFSIPTDFQSIFLYNPFKEVLINELITNVLKSHQLNNRSIYIIYLNPLFKQNFLNEGFKEVYAISRFSYIKACILCLEEK